MIYLLKTKWRLKNNKSISAQYGSVIDFNRHNFANVSNGAESNDERMYIFRNSLNKGYLETFIQSNINNYFVESMKECLPA